MNTSGWLLLCYLSHYIDINGHYNFKGHYNIKGHYNFQFKSIIATPRIAATEQ